MSQPTREQARQLNERVLNIIGKVMEKHTLAVLEGVFEELDKREAVAAAARALVEKIDAIHASPEYEAVWTLASNRGLPYRGPNYSGELQALRAVLERGPGQ